MPRSLVATRLRRVVAVVCVFAASAAGTTFVLASSRSARAQQSPVRIESPSVDFSPAPSSSSSSPLPALSTARVAIADELGRSIEVYPPLDPRPHAPIVVFLHATCMDPRPVCDLVGSSGRDGTFLVCPSGNDTCAGAPDWHGPAAEKSAFLSRALAKVDQRFGKYVEHDDTLIGWSRGAFAARDILYADAASGAPARFSSLVLIAAAVTPDPVRLRAAGIRRVFLTAGDQDGSRLTMKHAAATLTAAGIPSRYVSLGPIGHWLPDDLDERLKPGIAWVREK